MCARRFFLLKPPAAGGDAQQAAGTEAQKGPAEKPGLFTLRLKGRGKTGTAKGKYADHGKQKSPPNVGEEEPLR